MRTLVLDASIAIKWYFPEVLSEAALALISDKIQWVVPDLFYAETGNVLWKKVEQGETAIPVALDAMKSLLSLDMDVRATTSLLVPALEIALQFRCTVYDALYLSAAIAVDCPFVTADRKFYDVIGQTPLREYLLWIEDA